MTWLTENFHRQNSQKATAKDFILLEWTKRPLTAVVWLPESKAGGVGLSAGRQRQMEEQSVSGGREVKLIQHQPADASVD